jgi:hypothetical protein
MCYAVCSHLFIASELYNITLKKKYGKQAKGFVYRRFSSKKTSLNEAQILQEQNISLKNKDHQIMINSDMRPRSVTSG